jgi:hypothetical protein
MTKVSGFSVQVSASISFLLTPGTRHLKPSFLHSHPSLDASIEVVFDSTHFSDQVGTLNQPRMSIAASDEQLNSLSPPINEIENLVNRYQVVMNSHIRFIKNH